MNATSNISVRRPKSIYQQKAEFLFAEGGATAARDFAVDVASIAGADVTFEIATFLNSKGHAAESLSVLREICRTFEERLDVYETLGKRSKSGVAKTGAPVSSEASRVSMADCEYVTVLGNSYVRSFTKGTRFLPMMLAPGPSMSFLTPELAETTKRVVWNAVRHTDPKSLVLLVFGNADASTHSKNLIGTWQAVEDGKLSDHETVIRAAARRCFDLVEEIRTGTNLNLVLFSAAPMVTLPCKWMVEAFNEELFAYADRAGLPVLDLTAELTDPSTDFVWDRLRLAADDPHMTHELVPLVEDGLRKMNLLPGTSEQFGWDYLFRFSVDPEIETRIWGEAYMGWNKIMESQKFQLSQVLERAASVIIGHLAIAPNSSICVMNGREGFLPFEIARSFAADILSIDTRAAKTLMGQRVGRFLGRPDVRFVTTANLAEAVPACDFLFLATHEDDDRTQCRAAISAAMTKVRRRVLVLTPYDLAGELAASPGAAAVHEINLGNRFIKGHWAGVRLIAVTPAAA